MRKKEYNLMSKAVKKYADRTLFYRYSGCKRHGAVSEAHEHDGDSGYQKRAKNREFWRTARKSDFFDQRNFSWIHSEFGRQGNHGVFGFQPGDVAVSCCGLDQPSPICIQALTDCQVLCLPVSDCVEIIRTNLDMMAIYNRFLLKALQTHWQIKNAMYQYQALERYQWFLRNYPGLDEQVNSRYVASFLSITPVTLSRLRRWLKRQTSEEV